MKIAFNKLLDIGVIDYIFGLRAWGLILYGALPANLALLGTLEVKIGKLYELLPLMLPVSALPLLVTFLLIRSRQKDWYLTTDFLNIRSAVVTLIIVLCASLISGVSGIIHGKYILSLSLFATHGHFVTITESFLIAIATLVLTSTFFITILTKDTSLPGLPSSEFIKLIATIRGNIIQLQDSPIWQEFISLYDNKLSNQAEELKKNLEAIMIYPGNNLAKRSIEPIMLDNSHFIKVINEIKEGGNRDSQRLIWGKYFANFDVLSAQQKLDRAAEQNIFLAVRRLKQLRFGG